MLRLRNIVRASIHSVLVYARTNDFVTLGRISVKVLAESIDLRDMSEKNIYVYPSMSRTFPINPHQQQSNERLNVYLISTPPSTAPSTHISDDVSTRHQSQPPSPAPASSSQTPAPTRPTDTQTPHVRTPVRYNCVGHARTS